MRSKYNSSSSSSLKSKKNKPLVIMRQSTPLCNNNDSIHESNNDYIDSKRIESQKMDLLALGIDIDTELIARMQVNLGATKTFTAASKAANILKKKNPTVYQYPIITYRHVGDKEDVYKPSKNISLETKKAISILKDLQKQADTSSNNNINNRDTISKTISIFKDIYLQSQEKFIQHIMVNTYGNSSKSITKNCLMSENDLIRALLSLSPLVPKQNLKKVFELFQETSTSGERMVNVGVFLALLRMSIRRDNESKKSQHELSLEFWSKDAIKGSPIKAGRATGALTKGYRFAKVGATFNDNNDDDHNNENINNVAPFLKYWHEVEADLKQKHHNHHNFDKDPTIQSSNSVEILCHDGSDLEGLQTRPDIIPSRVPGTLTKREHNNYDVDMDRILKESMPLKNTKAEVKKRVGFHVDAYGKQTKSMLDNNSNNDDNDKMIPIFLSPNRPKSPTKKSSSDFIRLREESGICRKSNCTCGSHAVSTLTEGAGLPRYDPLNVQSTIPSSKDFDEILSPHKCSKGQTIDNKLNLNAFYIPIPNSQLNLRHHHDHATLGIKSTKGKESQNKNNEVPMSTILNLGYYYYYYHYYYLYCYY